MPESEIYSRKPVEQFTFFFYSSVARVHANHPPTPALHPPTHPLAAAHAELWRRAGGGRRQAAGACQHSGSLVPAAQQPAATGPRLLDPAARRSVV